MGADRELNSAISGYANAYGVRNPKGQREIKDFRHDASRGETSRIVLFVVCFLQFVLGLAAVSVSSFLFNSLRFSNKTQGWHDVLAVAIAVSVIILFVSIIGAWGARAKARPMLTFYFMAMALLGGFIFGGAIFAWTQSNHISEYLDVHWAQIQEMFATARSKAEVLAFLRKQLAGISAVFGLLLFVIILGLGASARVAGTAYVFGGNSVMLLIYGTICVILAFTLRREVVAATWILLYSSGGMLAVAAITGMVASIFLNKGAFVASTVLLIICVICFFYMAGWSYPRLLRTEEHVREFGIVLGLGLVAGYWSLLGLILVLVHYLESRTNIQVRAPLICATFRAPPALAAGIAALRSRFAFAVLRPPAHATAGQGAGSGGVDAGRCRACAVRVSPTPGCDLCHGRARRTLPVFFCLNGAETPRCLKAWHVQATVPELL
jgi:MFS family permease